MITKEIFEVIGLMLSLAALTLILNRNSNTVAVIKAGGGTFDQLLRTLTLQTQGSANFNSYSGGNGYIQ